MCHRWWCIFSGSNISTRGNSTALGKTPQTNEMLFVSYAATFVILLKSQADEDLSLLKASCHISKASLWRIYKLSVFLKMDKQLDSIILLYTFKLCVQGRIPNLLSWGSVLHLKKYMQMYWAIKINLVPLLPLSGESVVQQAGGIHTIRLASLISEKVQMQ